MRSLVAALVLAVAFAALARAASEPLPLRYGVADDWPKWHDCGDAWWQAAKDIGFEDVRLTVQWDETQPDVVPNEENLAAAVDCAVASGVRPILAVYPLHAAAIGPDPAAQARFAAFVAEVGAAYPQVDDFIVGNEPNVNRFWQPQYAAGADAAGTDYEHTLAASYDALKAVRSDAVVWGPAISSRGNDNPYAASNAGHSPVRFIQALGAAYRASARTRPIFDEFDMHPYPPVQDTAPFSRPFQWPQAGAADLDRVKQALWDAFGGTAQPVPAEYAGGRSSSAGLPIDLDEAGEQTTLDGHDAAYVRPVESIKPIGQAAQAARYVELARMAACDPDVRSVLLFPLVDDPGVADGFQSGELFADLSHKRSYAALKAQIAAAQGLCPGAMHRWVHTKTVVGAAVSFAGRRVTVTAGEDATFRVWLLPAVGRRPASARTATAIGAARAYRTPRVVVPAPARPGRYRIAVVLTADTNPLRTAAFASRTFRIGPPTRSK
ncbi:MAG TPA: hypothetical protein VGC78_13410 [Gaiellaceae bacterium]